MVVSNGDDVFLHFFPSVHSVLLKSPTHFVRRPL
jgi:hypothetical protein